MLGGMTSAHPIGRSNPRQGSGDLIDRIDDHEPEAAVVEGAYFLVRLRGEQKKCAVYAHPYEFLNGIALAISLMLGCLQDQAQSGIVDFLRGAGQNPPEVLGLN